MRNFLIGGGMMLVASAVHAQSPATAAPPAEASELAAGWSALARGDATEAAAVASIALGRYPWSVGAAHLLIEAETQRGGVDAGLFAYERWLGTRQFEAPYLLRIVARRILRDAARSGAGGDIRAASIQALMEDGDAEIAQEIQSAAREGGVLELSLRGRQGDDDATRALIANLNTLPGDRSIAIGALAQTRSRLAVQPLIQFLGEPLPATRAAAADALGDLEAKDAVGPLRLRLQDENFTVRFAAARALTRLGDSSGLGFLRELQRSESALLRTEALEATSTMADDGWVESVRAQLGDPDPDVRVLAAGLIAPHDQAAAVSAIQPLLDDPNPAVREGAARLFVDTFVMNAGSLRGFFRSPDPLIRVRAAVRLYHLTR